MDDWRVRMDDRGGPRMIVTRMGVAIKKGMRSH
jgi:hypothetical protein